MLISLIKNTQLLHSSFCWVFQIFIFQLLSKTCNVILSTPRSWMQVCAIHKLRKSWSTVCKLWIAQACLHDIGADKMRLQVLMRSWEMMSILNSITTTSLLVEKLSKMNCTHFLQNINKKNEKWRNLEILINKKIHHLEKNSWIWKYFKMWSLIYWKVVE